MRPKLLYRLAAFIPFAMTVAYAQTHTVGWRAPAGQQRIKASKAILPLPAAVPSQEPAPDVVHCPYDKGYNFHVSDYPLQAFAVDLLKAQKARGQKVEVIIPEALPAGTVTWNSSAAGIGGWLAPQEVFQVLQDRYKISVLPVYDSSTLDIYVVEGDETGEVAKGAARVTFQNGTYTLEITNASGTNLETIFGKHLQQRLAAYNLDLSKVTVAGFKKSDPDFSALLDKLAATVLANELGPLETTMSKTK